MNSTKELNKILADIEKRVKNTPEFQNIKIKSDNTKIINSADYFLTKTAEIRNCFIRNIAEKIEDNRKLQTRIIAQYKRYNKETQQMS